MGRTLKRDLPPVIMHSSVQAYRPQGVIGHTCLAPDQQYRNPFAIESLLTVLEQ